MVIKCQRRWLFAGTQGPPPELHHESLSAVRTGRRGEGEEEHLQGRSRRAVSLEMRKKIDSEVVKMMQLQNQVVSHKAIYTKGQIHVFLFLSRRIKKLREVEFPLSPPSPPFFGVNREILINSHSQVLKAFASFLFSTKVNHLLQNHGVLAKLHHWDG